MNLNTPKHFVVQLGALLALYVSITSVLVLLFNVINLQFHDEAAYYWEDENAREAIRLSIASLIVFFPAYLALTRITNQTRRKETGGKYTVVARWLIYLSLLVAGAILLGDLVALINTFLSGEITTRFLLKIFALLIVVGSAFVYYLLDVRGYFIKNIHKSFYFAAGATTFVIVSLIYSFGHIETPAEVREMRLDEQQVTDLQDIHLHIQDAYRFNEALPETISELYVTNKVPQAPEGREGYSYRKIDATHYELCATFLHPSTEELNKSPSYMTGSWEHEAGEWCFKRVAQPQKEV